MLNIYSFNQGYSATELAAGHQGSWFAQSPGCSGACLAQQLCVCLGGSGGSLVADSHLLQAKAPGLLSPEGPGAAVLNDQVISVFLEL